MNFASIDPGKNVTAIAWWEGSKLVAVRLDDPRRVVYLAPVILRKFAVIEVPTVYARSASKGDPNDLIQVAYAAGLAASAFEHVEQVAPRTWAGDVPKAVRHRRIRIDRPEIAAYLDGLKLPKTIAHNAWDAVGIGLWWISRAQARGAVGTRSTFA